MLEEVCFHHYYVIHIHQGQDQDNKEDDKSDCPDVLILHDGVGEVPQVISLVAHRGPSVQLGGTHHGVPYTGVAVLVPTHLSQSGFSQVSLGFLQ